MILIKQILLLTGFLVLVLSLESCSMALVGDNSLCYRVDVNSRIECVDNFLKGSGNVVK